MVAEAWIVKMGNQISKLKSEITGDVAGGVRLAMLLAFGAVEEDSEGIDENGRGQRRSFESEEEKNKKTAMREGEKKIGCAELDKERCHLTLGGPIKSLQD
ncbi:hypothetical protein CCACVL1_09595 [Corchorus capsularis]|uniref:Uncharacterized protein n=1 Tax=Corchorus capsularis TaxID=210143 RepID=A0A1R3IV20_COCAP|nr:hypothetical protein CCACVL1_09595 [Corchorus capsularis]